MSMRFVEKEGGPGIVFSDQVLSTMSNYRQVSPKAKEAGGQLFARFDGEDTIIMEATTPKILDKTGCFNVWRFMICTGKDFILWEIGILTRKNGRHLQIKI